MNLVFSVYSQARQDIRKERISVNEPFQEDVKILRPRIKELNVENANAEISRNHRIACYSYGKA
jgi:hypothetical protein